MALDDMKTTKNFGHMLCLSIRSKADYMSDATGLKTVKLAGEMMAWLPLARMRLRELEGAMLQVVQIMWKEGVELMKIAEHEKMERLYNQKQKKLEEMSENADQLA